MPGSEPRFSGKRWNRITDEDVEWYIDTRDSIVRALTADGAPPGYLERTPYEEYEDLQARKLAWSASYWNDPAAQRRLAELELRFGR